MHQTDAAQKRLAEAVARLAVVHRARLEELKAVGAKGRERDDFVWHYLLGSFATQGSSRGSAGVMANAENYRALSLESIDRYPAGERLARVERVFRAAKVRMPAKKAQWLLSAHARVKAMGGPTAASKVLLSMTDRDAMIAWLRMFDGIGPKYGRNIMMDVYHPAFRDVVAVDARIKGVSRALGRSFKRFADEEAFYVSVAGAAGLEPWEVDRIIYWYQAEVLRALDQSGDLAPAPTSIHVEAVAEEVVRAVERDGLSTTVVAHVLRRFM